MMGIRSRAVVVGIVAVVALGAIPLVAQEATPEKPGGAGAPPALKRAYDPSRRVPRFFGQIGLSPEQKEEIYKIRGKHHPKLKELHEQIARVQSQMVSECEALLTESQKQSLADRRRASEKARKEKAALAAPDAAKPAAKPGD